MVKQTTRNVEPIRDLLERRNEAIKGIKKATRELRTVENAIRIWLCGQLAPTYEQWSPQIGEVAVYVVLGERSKFAYKLYVRELYGTWVRFNEGENSHAYTRFNLGDYEKYFKDGKDLTDVEFIVPAHTYERHVRHWFGLPKFDELER